MRSTSSRSSTRSHTSGWRRGPGEFARRGGIIDVFPCGAWLDSTDLGHDRPLAFRIELWGNEIDSIRAFDPSTQRSTDKVERFAIGPAHEVSVQLAEEDVEAL